MIKAFVGAGGKTTEIFKEAEYFRGIGKKVFVCTSTHMFIQNDTLISDNKEEIINELNKKGYVFAGTKAEDKKIGTLSYDTYLSLCQKADVVLVEADGSKHKSLKFPNENEPVIYDNVDEIVVVAGLKALGKTAFEECHRYEKGSLKKDDIISAKTVQLMKNMYFKKLKSKFPHKKISVFVTGADNMYKKAVASLLNDNMDVNLIDKEWFENKPVLFVCGGGHISLEISKLAQFLDYKTVVMDPREEFANKERFPLAENVICDDFDNIEKYDVKNAFYIVVTRGHADDLKCVSRLLKIENSYLGMIGSKKKVKATFESLKEMGFSEEEISKIHAPIGIPIKAITPAEIAVSIMAQIIDIRNTVNPSSVSKELLNTDEEGVLCIITKKEGSSPRGEGSMMFVTKDRIIDSIGGGIIEALAIKKARTVTKCVEEEYVLDNKTSADTGMICGGYNKVLFIPINNQN